MYRAKLSVAMGPSVCARKSLSLIHRQKLASGSNYDRACVRRGTCVGRASGQHVHAAEMGSRRRREAAFLYDHFHGCAFFSLFPFIKILMGFILWQ